MCEEQTETPIECSYAINCNECNRNRKCVKYAVNNTIHRLWLVVNRNRDYIKILSEAESKVKEAINLINILERLL